MSEAEIGEMLASHNKVPAVILEIGYRITETFTDPAAMADDAVTDYVGRAARKRFGYAVEPSKVISWDHTKLIS